MNGAEKVAVLEAKRLLELHDANEVPEEEAEHDVLLPGDQTTNSKTEEDHDTAK